MNSKFLRYITEGLAFSGLAILDNEVALRMRPDVWATPNNALVDFLESKRRLDQHAETIGAQKFVVRFVDGAAEGIPMLARSAANLAQRIEWLTGLKVRAVTEVGELFPVEGSAPPQSVPEAVDGESLPAWACAKRTELLRRAGYDRDPLFGTKV